VPTICLKHLSEAQVKALMIADNKLAQNAEWDEPLLAQLFKDLSSDLNLDFTVNITGFEMGEIDVMIEGLAPPPDGNDPADVVPERSDAPAVTKPGDLWVLGLNYIYCGDCREKKGFAILMNGKKAVLAFIDSPYNVKIKGHVSGLGTVQHREFSMASGEMSEDEFISFLLQVFLMLADNSVDGAIIFSCCDWRHLGEMLTAGKQAFGALKNICCWVKDNGGMGAFYRSQHELIFVFKHGTAPHKNNFLLGQHGRYRTNVWQYPGANSFSRQSEEGNLLEMHPTVKPVAMVADAIMDCSERGDIVLDSFLGSGTTLIAAERTGRVCYGMEIDPLYVDVAIRRWQKLTGKKAIHAVTGKPFDGED
jgi:DNA modification methylase